MAHLRKVSNGHLGKASSGHLGGGGGIQVSWDGDFNTSPVRLFSGLSPAPLTALSSTFFIYDYTDGVRDQRIRNEEESAVPKVYYLLWYQWRFTGTAQWNNLGLWRRPISNGQQGLYEFVFANTSEYPENVTIESA